jgi:hypothetical protein
MSFFEIDCGSHCLQTCPTSPALISEVLSQAVRSALLSSTTSFARFRIDFLTLFFDASTLFLDANTPLFGNLAAIHAEEEHNEPDPNGELAKNRPQELRNDCRDHACLRGQ